MPQVRWNRDQLLLALRLYMRTPFGRLHRLNPEIIDLAAHLGRTPDALAMKACNFASLDPAITSTNRRGLPGTSAADRAIWSEFFGNPEALAAEAETAAMRLVPGTVAVELSDLRVPAGETDTLRIVRARRVQSFFRAAVLASYGNRCAISGLPVAEMLVASHIIPWSDSVERRADPTNGIALNAMFDRAFDRALITIDEEFRVVVAARLRKASAEADLHCSIAEAHGRPLLMPSRFRPDPAALDFHRSRFTD